MRLKLVRFLSPIEYKDWDHQCVSKAARSLREINPLGKRAIYTRTHKGDCRNYRVFEMKKAAYRAERTEKRVVGPKIGATMTRQCSI